jgi:hypothetical protein
MIHRLSLGDMLNTCRIFGLAHHASAASGLSSGHGSATLIDNATWEIRDILAYGRESDSVAHTAIIYGLVLHCAVLFVWPVNVRPPRGQKLCKVCPTLSSGPCQSRGELLIHFKLLNRLTLKSCLENWVQVHCNYLIVSLAN